MIPCEQYLNLYLSTPHFRQMTNNTFQTNEPFLFPLHLLLVIILSLMLSSCSEPAPIKIGYVAGLTGRHSEVGIGVRNGVLLAVETINETGGINGRQIEVLLRDDKDDPKEAVRVIDELITLEVPVIIGPLLSKMANATIETIRGKNVLVISPTISTDQVSNRDDNFLRLISEGGYQGESIASAVLKTDLSRLAVVYDSANGAYTRPIYTIFNKRMVEGGKNIVYVNDLSGGQETDLVKVATEIVDLECDGLFIITSGIDAGELSQQVRKRDTDVQLYGSSWVKTGRVIEIGGRNVEGMILSTIFERSQKSPEYVEFATRLQQQFKSKPNFTSVYAFEAVQVMAEGMRSSNSFEPEKIKGAILEKSAFKGLEEDFRLNRYGDVIRSKSLVQIKDGHYVRFEP